MPPLLQSQSPEHDTMTHDSDSMDNEVVAFERRGVESSRQGEESSSNSENGQTATNLRSESPTRPGSPALACQEPTASSPSTPTRIVEDHPWRRESSSSQSPPRSRLRTKGVARKSVHFASATRTFPGTGLPHVPRDELWYTPFELMRIRHDCAQTVQQRMALIDLLQPRRSDDGIYDQDENAQYSIRGLEHRCINTRYARYRKAAKEHSIKAVLLCGSGASAGSIAEAYGVYSEEALASAHLQALHDEQVAKKLCDVGDLNKDGDESNGEAPPESQAGRDQRRGADV